MLGLGAVISPKAKSHVLLGSLETSGQSGSYISIPIDHNLFKNDHSWSAWIKLPVSNINTTSFGYRDSNRTVNQAYYVDIFGQDQKENARGVITVAQVSTGLSTKSVASNISKTDSRSGGWYNIVVLSKSIERGRAIEKLVYVNGQENVSTERFHMTEAQKTSFNPTSAFIFGGENRTSNSTIVHTNAHRVRLAGFSAWDTILSENEIASIYKGGSGIKVHKNIGNYVSSNNLVLNYNFNSGRKDGIYRSTGTSSDSARAFDCNHVSDHPSYSKGRLQG